MMPSPNPSLNTPPQLAKARRTWKMPIGASSYSILSANCGVGSI